MVVFKATFNNITVLLWIVFKLQILYMLTALSNKGVSSTHIHYKVIIYMYTDLSGMRWYLIVKRSQQRNHHNILVCSGTMHS